MTRLMFIGGFLGAGKTTLIGKTAELFAGKNQKVGIITNDQASELVDTALLRCGGNETAEGRAYNRRVDIIILDEDW